MIYNNSIDWNNVIKKEARGFDSANLGEVHKVRRDNAITKSAVVNKEVYVKPRSLVVEKFDGQRIMPRVTKEESESHYKVKE